MELTDIFPFAPDDGYLILALGKSRLIAAERIPTDEEDLAAMKDNANTNQ